MAMAINRNKKQAMDKDNKFWNNMISYAIGKA
jgi:hypothetical protein